MAENTADGNSEHQIRFAQQLRTLIMPSEMGEFFKVIALTRKLSDKMSNQLIGFSHSDLRHQL